MPKKKNQQSRTDLERELRAAQAKIIWLHLEIAEHDCGLPAEIKHDHQLVHLIEAFNALPAAAYDKHQCLEHFGTCPPPPMRIPRALRHNRGQKDLSSLLHQIRTSPFSAERLKKRH